LLTFDVDAGRWCWNLDRLHAKGYTDNVVDLMVGRLVRRPEKTQQVLAKIPMVPPAWSCRRARPRIVDSCASSSKVQPVNQGPNLGAMQDRRCVIQACSSSSSALASFKSATSNPSMNQP
jgi:hypothetical protein